MKMLMIANDLSEVKPLGDSSLYMLREMMERGIECYWTKEEDLAWHNDDVWVNACPVQKAEFRHLPELGKEERLKFTNFDYCFIRKDPPFNDRYTRLCWLLIPFENKVRMINKPSLLVKYHEKIVPLFAVADGDLLSEDLIPTCLPACTDEAIHFVNEMKEDKVVVKPWLGYAGHNIQLLDKEKFLSNPGSYVPRDRYFILQPFDEAVYEQGDLRVFFVAGKYVEHFARIPAEGSFVSNLGQGGSAAARDLTKQEREVIGRLENWLVKVGIDFAGADLINGRMNEVNITSPTGIPHYEELTEINVAKALVDSIL
jgi:glutathione synthase